MKPNKTSRRDIYSPGLSLTPDQTGPEPVARPGCAGGPRGPNAPSRWASLNGPRRPGKLVSYTADYTPMERRLIQRPLGTLGAAGGATTHKGPRHRSGLERYALRSAGAPWGLMFGGPGCVGVSVWVCVRSCVGVSRCWLICVDMC